MSNVLFEIKEHVGVITINRPKALNALNADVLAELLTTVKEADAYRTDEYDDSRRRQTFCSIW